jgi:hypothetical protein
VKFGDLTRRKRTVKDSLLTFDASVRIYPLMAELPLMVQSTEYEYDVEANK